MAAERHLPRAFNLVHLTRPSLLGESFWILLFLGQEIYTATVALVAFMHN
jgi:hypothetical protein